MIIKMAQNIVRIFVFLAIVCSMRCTGLQYLFTSPEFTLPETGVEDITTVIIQRTSEDATETAVETTVILNVQCPTECTLSTNDREATQGASADYIVSKTIIFPANILQQTVAITINDDTEAEPKEYFCLTVSDTAVRGSQFSTKVFIPWNDDCIQHLSMADGGTNAASPGYDIRDANTAVNGYVGPWSPADSGTITLKLTPQAAAVTAPATGDGQDIGIFLATGADVTNVAAVNFYGILLDDVNGMDASHAGGAQPASYFIKNALNMGIGTPDMAIDFVVPDVENTFELTYNAGTITLRRTSPVAAPVPMLTVMDADAYAIGHLFVSSALNKFALWEICGLQPRKLPTTSADASGFSNLFSPDKAIDGARDLSSCFVSAVATGATDHWLQIDLGREYEVKQVVIFPITLADAMTGLATPDSLDMAKIYVGSCRSDDITSNHACSGDIGDVADATGAMTQVPIIGVTCTGTNVYGRYVYVVPMTSTNPIALCDIRVYGDEVSLDMETKVYFTGKETPVAEDVAAGNVILPLTRTGAGRTCTYVDYYTESSEGDFTQILPNSAVEVKISGGTADTQSSMVTVAITNDGVCESPESFNVFLTDVEGAQKGPQCYTSFKITDDDASTYFIVPAVNTIREDMGPLVIAVTRTGDTLEQGGGATLTLKDVTATSTDYSNAAQPLTYAVNIEEDTASVAITNDNCYEETETFQVTLEQLEPEGCSSIGTVVPLTLTITDDDSKFHWEQSTLTVSEGDGARIINIIRTGTLQEKDVEFDIASLGATYNTDYKITPETMSVKFMAGDVSKFITITLQEDKAVEGAETFTLTLRDPLAAACPGGNRGDPYVLSVTIDDNDAVISWEQDDYSLAESDGACQVCLIRSGDTNTIETVQITSLPVTATAETDYQPLTFLTFTNSAKVCAQIQVIGDEAIEGDETFILQISPNQDLTIGNPSNTTITIIDDDANIGWVRTSYEVVEGSGNSLTVQISKTGDIEVTATVTSSPATATASDFVSVSRTFTIPASVSLYSLEVQIIDDAIPEGDEQFALTLQGSSTGHVRVGATTVTIRDNDGGIPTTNSPATTATGGGGGASDLGVGAIVAIAISSVLGLFTIIMLIVISFCLCPRFCNRLRGVRQPAMNRTPAQVPNPTLGMSRMLPTFNSLNDGYALDYGNYGNYGNPYQTDDFGSPLAIRY